MPAISVKDHSVSQEAFQLQRCTSCGFLATTPRPSAAEIGPYYDSEDYVSHSNTKRGAQFKLYQAARRHALRTKHAQIEQYHPAGNVLDYGCGTGEFLGHLKTQGYQATGIEPNPKARAQATQSQGVTAYATLEELPRDSTYQVITLWHVLEHIHNLLETTRQLFDRLTPGGVLIIAVPDRESWDAQHYGADWAAYDVPRHLWHFRRRDVQRLLEQQGLRLDRIAPMWLDAPYIAMHSERYRGAGALTALIKGGILGSWSNVVAATTQRPTSSSLFFAVKP
ncbi:MAG: class I SAM-dependent methyltransferase [Flavobacteriales bacterium]